MSLFMCLLANPTPVSNVNKHRTCPVGLTGMTSKVKYRSTNHAYEKIIIYHSLANYEHNHSLWSIYHPYTNSPAFYYVIIVFHDERIVQLVYLETETLEN